MTVTTSSSGLKIREVYPEEQTAAEQWNELAERVAQALASGK